MPLDGQDEIVYSEGVNNIRYGALLVGLCTVVACQTQQTQDGQNKQTVNGPAPLHLGAVHQVFPDQGFATLRFIGPVPPAGTTLITHPPDGSNSRVGNLQLPLDLQVRDSYVVATIRSGVVFQGDRVFMYRNIGQTTPGTPSSETGGTTPSIPGDGSQLGTPDAGSMGITQPSAATLPAATPANLATASTQPSTPYPAASNLQPLPEHQQEEVPVQPTTQPARKASGSGSIPDYLNDIPDNVNDWD